MAWSTACEGFTQLFHFCLWQDLQLKDYLCRSTGSVVCWSSQWSLAGSVCGRAWSWISPAKNVSSSEKRNNLLSSHENARLVVEEGDCKKSPRMQIYCDKTWASRWVFISVVILMALFASLHRQNILRTHLFISIANFWPLLLKIRMDHHWWKQIFKFAVLMTTVTMPRILWARTNIGESCAR